MRAKLYKSLLVTALLLVASDLWAGDLKRVFRAIEKADFQRAIELLNENLQDEPVNPGSRWMYAKLLSTDSLSYYDLELAREYIDRALIDYDSATADVLEDLAKDGVSKDDLLLTVSSIHDQTYSNRYDKYTLNSFYNFLSIYPESDHRQDLLLIIDSLAYDSVASIDTWGAYQGYMTSFSESRFASRAEENYESLLYVDMTSSDRLTAYQKFIREFPGSPYKQDAIEVVFQRTTDSNTPDVYKKYLREYPDGDRAEFVTDLLYHLDKEVFLKDASMEIQQSARDSLEMLIGLDSLILLPMIQGQTFGMIDLSGNWRMKPDYPGFVGENQFCQTYREDIVIVQGDENLSLVNRLGDQIYSGEISNVRDIGSGFLVLTSEDRLVLVHKSGTVIDQGFQDAGVLGGKWLKIKRNGKWTLATWYGKSLTGYQYDDVYTDGRFWIFERNGQQAIHNRAFVEEGIGKADLQPNYNTEEYELINDSLMLAFRDSSEALIDHKMVFHVPWETNREIYVGDSYNYSKGAEDYKIYNEQFIAYFGEEVFSDMIVTDDWFAFRSESWNLVANDGERMLTGIDSLQLLNPMSLLVVDRDSSYVLFPNGHYELIRRSDKLNPLVYRGEDGRVATAYLELTRSKVKSIWNSYGEMMFEGVHNEIVTFTDSLFRITVAGKQGVIDSEGKKVISTRYEFIQQKELIAQLLRNGRIEGFDLKKRAILADKFDAKFDRFGDYYLSQQGEYFGVMEADGTEIIDFAYRQITWVNDSVAWVQNDSSWQLIRLADQGVVYDDVKDFDLLAEIDGRKIWRTFDGVKYGLIDSDLKLRFEYEYSDLRIIENGTDPVVLGEVYVDAAPFYVVILFDLDGKTLYSDALRPDQYDLIYCE